MKCLSKIFFTVSLMIFTSFSVFAHTDHNHGPKKELAMERVKPIAEKHIRRLVGNGKLTKTWLKAEHASSEKMPIKNHTEWVVTYKNLSEQDVTKQTLFVFISLSGEFIAANFSGK